MGNTINSVFVYGTLKVGGHFAKRLDSYRANSTPHTLRNLALYDLGSFPTIAPSKNENDVVVGEIHDFKSIEEVLEIMDFIEGYRENNKENSLYIRSIININLNGKNKSVYVYMLNENMSKMLSEKNKIKNGIWKI